MPLAMPGIITQALRWMTQADAPLRIAPRLDFPLLAWMMNFARLCNWSDFKRLTAAKAPLLKLSRQALEELIRSEKLDCEFETLGTLTVYREPGAFEKSAWLPQALRDVGLPIEILDGAACRAREPVLNDSIVGGYFHPLDAHLRPNRYVAELARVVRARGGEIHESTTLGGFSVESGRIESVTTSAGKFHGRDIVLALGAWSPLLARQLDLRIPIQPGKGYSITYTRPEHCPRIPLALKERAVCVTGWSSGYRLGSTMEFAGYDGSLNRTRLDALRRGAAAYLRAPVGAELREEWWGWRPMCVDETPLIGPVNRWHNLLLATGHGMLGVSMSAATAELVVSLIACEPPVLDARAYSPARLGL